MPDHVSPTVACAVERGRVFCLTPIPAGDPKPVRDVAPWMRPHCPATGIQDPVIWYERHPAGSDGGRASRNQPTAGRGALCPCRGMHSCRGGSCGRSGSQYTRNAFAFRMRRSSYHYMRRNAFELFYLLRTRIAKRGWCVILLRPAYVRLPPRFHRRCFGACQAFVARTL